MTSQFDAGDSRSTDKLDAAAQESRIQADSNSLRSPAGRPRYWLAYVLPLAVFLVATSLEPTRSVDGASSGILPYHFYPIAYAIKITLTVGALAWSWPAARALGGRLSPLAGIVGVVGVVLWIALCQIDLPHPAISWVIGERGARSAFNPLMEIETLPLAWAFLVVRFIGLVVVVPIAEELFYRGFLMRFVTKPDWWTTPFGEVTTMGLLVGTAIPVLAHPERLAALVWFSLVSWLMVRTRSFWDCVVAHSITNLLLGIYVVATGNWWLM